jgi:hypothetical protein
MAHQSSQGSDGSIERVLESPQVRQAIESYYAVRGPHPDPELNAIALAVLIEDVTGERLRDDDIRSLSTPSGPAELLDGPAPTRDL